MTTRGFGLAGETPVDTILAAATAAEDAGFDTFWLSQPQAGSTLKTLRQVADRTTRIRLGVGAIPFTRNDPEDIHRELADLGFPLHRLRLGVGSGTGPGSLARLRNGIARLRELIDVEIVVAPLGPKMCALAGELADTVLLNWLTPGYAETSKAWIADGASRAKRAVPMAATYVRCAIGDESWERLNAECHRYGSFPHYAAHFRRQGVPPSATTIHAASEDELRARLDEYDRVLDHVVARAITPDDHIDDVLAVVAACRPA